MSPSRLMTRQFLTFLNRSGYFGKLVRVCHTKSLGAAISKHDTERARCFLLARLSLSSAVDAVAVAAVCADSAGGAVFDCFAKQKSVPESVTEAIRQRTVLVYRGDGASKQRP